MPTNLSPGGAFGRAQISGGRHRDARAGSVVAGGGGSAEGAVEGGRAAVVEEGEVGSVT